MLLRGQLLRLYHHLFHYLGILKALRVIWLFDVQPIDDRVLDIYSFCGDLYRNLIILALKMLTSICCMIVAPSFETITSPSGLTSILSIPFGPRDVFKTLATVLAAMMLAYIK